MTITVATKKLIDALTDGMQTAYSGIHLGTHRGPFGEEPGDVDLLSVTSSTGYVAGHTWLPCEGQMAAMVWPVSDTKTVVTIARSLLARRGKEHTVDIDMVVADPPEDGGKDGEHPGWVVTVRETPALFESDTEFQFHAFPEGRFPIDGVNRMLRGLFRPTEGFEESPLTVWSASVIGPVVAVAQRRNSTMQFFTSPQTHRVLVQIGDNWLGAVMPVKVGSETRTDGPSVEPVLPELPESALADMLNDGGEAGSGDDSPGSMDSLFSDAPKPAGGE
ncbi:hypothetical protein B1R94_02145 [Mycolicibacterium litorale]|nr:hypothetical protein B1R94_02145 [Mycolicibacterium litorale]